MKVFLREFYGGDDWEITKSLCGWFLGLGLARIIPNLAILLLITAHLP